jgi:Transposase zinc-binding domain/Putative transposase
MKAAALELGDIFRIHGPAYSTTFGDSLSREQWKALRAIAACRTAALGGHVDQCDQCGYRKISYCSCRNRHCPKCHGQARAQWLEQRTAELLPVEYFHVVFTLPQLLAPLALQNQRLVYGILFRAAAETLLQIAGDPRHLGARIGFLAVLHTWGQNLHHHPHLHCVVPGGGIAPDQCRWISCRRQFLFPVKVLSRLFRGKFVAYLKTAFRRGDLGFHGQLESLGEKNNFLVWLNRVAGSEWVVYAKPPFGGP